MKNVICWILAFHLSSPAAMADALDDAVTATKQLRDTVSAQFPSYVSSMTDFEITSHFTFEQWDHLSVRKMLADKATAGMLRLNSIENEFDQLTSSLSTQGQNWDENATRAFALIAETQNLQTEAAQIAADAKSVQNSWLNQCTAPLQLRLVQAADPLTYVQLIDAGEAPTPQPNFEVHAQVSSDFSADGTHTSASAGSMNDTDGMITTVGFALISSLNPYAILAGIIILAGWAIYKICSYLVQVGEIAKKRQEIADYRDQIRQIQLDTLNSVSHQVPQMVAETCAKTFPASESENIYLKIFNDYQARANQQLTDLVAKRSQVLAAFNDRYINLLQFYFPSVSAKYAQLVDQRFTQTQMVEAQTTEVLQKIMSPLLLQYQTDLKSGGAVAWKSAQDLWTGLIQADAVFRSDAGFSFTPASAGTDGSKHFSNSWNAIGPKISGVIQ